MSEAPKFAQSATIVVGAGLLAVCVASWLLTLSPAPEPVLGSHAHAYPAGLSAPVEHRRVSAFAAPEQTTITEVLTTTTLTLPEPELDPVPSLSDPDLDPVPSLSDMTTEPVVLDSMAGAVPGITDFPLDLQSGPIVIRSRPSGVPAPPRAGVAAIPVTLESDRVILSGQVPATPPLPDAAWNPAEFELLIAPPVEADLLASITDGTVVTPIQPLTVEELLATDQAVQPIAYTTPGIGIGTPVPLPESGQTPAAGYLPEGQIQLESAEFLDYDEEGHSIYGHGRVTARFGQYKLVADKLLVDTRLRELQAEGNVVITSPNEYVEASAIQFDTRTNMGVAYNARGRSSAFYFLADPFENGGRTTFRQLSRDESHFKHSSFTTCDFPVPHYRISAKEFTVFANDRIFARNVILYIMEKPIFWLPYYTRSFVDESPWALNFGTDRELGFFTRVSYNYQHSSFSPSDVDDRLMIRRSKGTARIMWDYFSKRGTGRGLQYKYRLNDNQHRGQMYLYQLSDKERDVENGTEDRSYINIFHRTNLGKGVDGADLSALVDVDYVSDPELFFDLFDRLRGSGELARGRISTRHGLFGLSRTHDDYFAGVRVELRDRLGRDRFSSFWEPKDDDFDYDRRFNDEQFFTLDAPGVGPDGRFYSDAGRYTDRTQLPGMLDLGVDSDRFGRASARLPQLTVSTNRQRLWCLPLWYHLDLNVFNNLDKGLNVVGTEDDSFVPGFDLYQSLTHLKRFSERYTLLTKAGIGFGAAQRLDDSYNVNFPEGTTFPFVQDGQVIGGRVVGVTFTNPDTFLVGQRSMSLKDVDPFFAYGDLDSKFNARITDSLTAFARYRGRLNVGNNLGQFYERTGMLTARDDLYDFRTPEQWIEAGLNYALAQPRLNFSLSTGRNLQDQNDFTPNELTQYVNLSSGWANRRNTLLVNTGVSLQDRQLRDPTDPFSYIANTLTYYVAASWLPVHQRHYARIGAFFVQNTSDDPSGISTGSNRNFDTANETILNSTIGKKVGQKYLLETRTQLRTRQGGTNDSWLTLTRDFHDAVAGISVGFRGDTLSRREETTDQDNMQLRFHFRLKAAAETGVTPVRTSGDLFSDRKVSAFETRN